MLKDSLAVTSLALLNIPEWALPALAQGETLVPFTDAPAAFPPPGPVNRQYDIRTIDGPFSPADRFFTTQHYGHPVVEPAAFRLKLSGLLNRPLSLSLDELRKVGSTELIAGFECSGNRRPLQGLCGNGRWTGVPLRAVLDRAGGLKPQAREIVFFGADRGQEEVEFRTQKFSVEQQYGRSMTREQLVSSDAFLGLGAQRRTADAASRLAAASPRARMVRHGEREVAGAGARAGRRVSWQVPGASLPHAAGRDDRRRSEMDGGRHHAPCSRNRFSRA